ncbi:hypothetical protein FA13DRAFT_1802650 [Coprinellus micaceus]|uniref:Uncharacterized protein n=1 Tax=Coprinellus micaceus TaxID=71717 RepID=A0A4Y7SCN7_COPMI|nr:hypothetical protein FA13DRAFT_1802650 [Coprinellus micaceus]
MPMPKNTEASNVAGFVESKNNGHGAVTFIEAVTAWFKVKFKGSPSPEFAHLGHKISQWFPNVLCSQKKCQTVMKGNPKVNAKDLNTGGRKKLQPWQAYLRVFHDVVAKAVNGQIQEKYSHLTKSENAKKRFAIQNAIAKELWSKATDDEKAKVEDYCERHLNYQENDDDEDSTNRCYLDGINRIVKTFDTQTDALRKQTGWCQLMWAGGPHPGMNGELSSVIRGEGLTKDGKTFHQWLEGNPKLKGRFEGILDAFMHDCYSKADCDTCVLAPVVHSSDNEVFSDASSDTEAFAQKNFKVAKGTLHADSSPSPSDGGDDSSSSSDEDKIPKSKKTKSSNTKKDDGPEPKLPVKKGEEKRKCLMKAGDGEQDNDSDGGQSKKKSKKEQVKQTKKISEKTHKRARAELQDKQGATENDITDIAPAPIINSAPISQTAPIPEYICNEGGDIEASETESNDSEASVVESNGKSLPTWLSEHGTWSMITAASESKRWQALTLAYLTFETHTKAGNGCIATVGRPLQVHEWTGYRGHLKATIPVLDTAVFDDETWKGLKKGGSGGLYVMLLCMAWWYKGLEPGVKAPSLLRAMKRDMAFVFESLVKSMGADGVEEQPSAKCQVLKDDHRVKRLIGTLSEGIFYDIDKKKVSDILQECSKICGGSNETLSQVLQGSFFGGHTPFYWAITNKNHRSHELPLLKVLAFYVGALTKDQKDILEAFHVEFDSVLYNAIKPWLTGVDTLTTCSLSFLQGNGYCPVITVASHTD